MKQYIRKQVAFDLLGFLFLTLIVFVLYYTEAWRQQTTYGNSPVTLNIGQMVIDLAWITVFWITGLLLFRWSLKWPGLSHTLKIVRGIGLVISMVLLLALVGMMVSLSLVGYHPQVLPCREWGFGPVEASDTRFGMALEIRGFSNVLWVFDQSLFQRLV